MSILPLRTELIPFLNPYLPASPVKNGKVSVTLTYAQSIDAKISKGPGIRTAISHAETKSMTHYLRYHHDAILVGSGTALADDPGLNCKWVPANNNYTKSFDNSPRPIILDTKQKWSFKGSKMYDLFMAKEGKSPIVIVTKAPTKEEEYVSYLVCPSDPTTGYVDWKELLQRLNNEYGINSVMIEGGANVIQQLLTKPDIVDNLIVTIGSIYLGKSGVGVSPDNSVELTDIDWWKGTTDTIMCARLSS
ncbi:2,5-diamino-6-(ribosylamino)-4(3H)-pyrimidinone 5'-phosphate reductase NDAI_0A06950 [Naumovozyma dairenensis CBS 421]|uniref:2,5-diamino-6-ribosylamino-4(3H)-pyrimidinone 5'-phosphate reductase n=1 Tax=Naumovozyma dairenensis (strain ATCC 10597 / BCRC 20456 / CBS 421 / NBRC 0211 / NRRL Y-12639) TaxID=1071378 RepID=G0W4W1_NAUDC|nr:hypothetical protein NDAI_0A06950 [Naumovozyma dairenensis CBS 421]CCD22849.1 hypothetical protein NDAI_0A06950 [Naumovozyma dairenensis CBS 421]